MYKLPSDFDTTFLIGAVLEMICFNANQIYFHFNRNISFVVENNVFYTEARTAVEKKVDVSCNESNLMQLLEHAIEQAKADSSGTLTTVFDNGAVLKLVDTSEQYESYKIVVGDKVTIV